MDTVFIRRGLGVGEGFMRGEGGGVGDEGEVVWQDSLTVPAMLPPAGENQQAHCVPGALLSGVMCTFWWTRDNRWYQ